MVMPERLADTDPFQSIKEVVGSGPFHFVASERWSAAKSSIRATPTTSRVQAKRPIGWQDRRSSTLTASEWTVMPDPATAAAALEDADLWENPPNDLPPILDRSANGRTEANGPLGTMGTGVFNHLFPPFAGGPAGDPASGLPGRFHDRHSGHRSQDVARRHRHFHAQPPMASNSGTEIISAPKPDLTSLGKRLHDAGYQGERIILMSASDQVVQNAQCNVAMDLMQKLGMEVDLAVMDWGTLVQRRASKAPPDKGGWNMFITAWSGLDMTTPITNQTLRSNGPKAWFGWPDLPPVQSLIDVWVEPPDVPSQERIAAEIQAKALEWVPYFPTGQYFTHTAAGTTSPGSSRVSSYSGMCGGRKVDGGEQLIGSGIVGAPWLRRSGMPAGAGTGRVGVSWVARSRWIQAERRWSCCLLAAEGCCY
jgi:peptide/nickel transport system substrate-binding protein